MNYLPMEVLLSKSTTKKFAIIKQRTGITPNLMGRVALMKALEAGVILNALKPIEVGGQKIPKDVFFGDNADIYEVVVELFIKESSYDGSVKDLVNMLVDYGSHSIPIIRTMADLESVL